MPATWAPVAGASPPIAATSPGSAPFTASPRGEPPKLSQEPHPGTPPVSELEHGPQRSYDDSIGQPTDALPLDLARQSDEVSRQA